MRILLAALTTLLIALFTHSYAQAQTQSSSAPSCSLVSEGIYRGAWVKHRIFVNDEAIFGANDMGAILDMLENLRSEGLCR